MIGSTLNGRFSVNSPSNDKMNLRSPNDGPVKGVIILSPSCDPLYLSPEATQLIKPFTAGPSANPSGVSLPPLLRNIGHEVRHQLQASLKQGNGLTCDVARSISSPEGTLFVRGLGGPSLHNEEFLTTLVVSRSPIQLSLSNGACDEPCNQHPDIPASPIHRPQIQRVDAASEGPGSRPERLDSR